MVRMIRYSAVGVLVFAVFGLGLIGLSVQPALAQSPQRTPIGSGGGNLPTVQAPAGQVTIPVISTPERNGDGAATAAAFATVVSGSVANIQATAAAVLTALPTLPGDYTLEDLEAWLTALSENGSISYDPATGTLTVEAEVSETAMNVAIDQALSAAGYEASAVSVDVVDGALIVTAEDVELNSQISGTLVMTVEIAVVNDVAVVTVSSATINGYPVPASTLDDLTAVMQSAIDALLQPSGELNYTVNAVTLMDDALYIAISVQLPTG